LVAFTLGALAVAAGLGDQTTPTAEQVLAKAKAKAAEQHKRIFLIFDASW
jgi:hypothetical protein